MKPIWEISIALMFAASSAAFGQSGSKLEDGMKSRDLYACLATERLVKVKVEKMLANSLEAGRLVAEFGHGALVPY